MSRCPRCDRELPAPSGGRGRPRVWCSTECRRRAAAERAAAGRAGMAVRVVEVRRNPPVSSRPRRRGRPTSVSQLAEAMQTDPRVCARILDGLTELARDKALHPDVRAAARRLARAVLPHP